MLVIVCVASALSPFYGHIMSPDKGFDVGARSLQLIAADRGEAGPSSSVVATIIDVVRQRVATAAEHFNRLHRTIKDNCEADAALSSVPDAMLFVCMPLQGREASHPSCESLPSSEC